MGDILAHILPFAGSLFEGVATWFTGKETQETLQETGQWEYAARMEALDFSEQQWNQVINRLNEARSNIVTGYLPTQYKKARTGIQRGYEDAAAAIESGYGGAIERLEPWAAGEKETYGTVMDLIQGGPESIWGYVGEGAYERGLEQMEQGFGAAGIGSGDYAKALQDYSREYPLETWQSVLGTLGSYAEPTSTTNIANLLTGEATNLATLAQWRGGSLADIFRELGQQKSAYEQAWASGSANIAPSMIGSLAQMQATSAQPLIQSALGQQGVQNWAMGQYSSMLGNLSNYYSLQNLLQGLQPQQQMTGGTTEGQTNPYFWSNYDWNWS